MPLAGVAGENRGPDEEPGRGGEVDAPGEGPGPGESFGAFLSALANSLVRAVASGIQTVDHVSPVRQRTGASVEAKAELSPRRRKDELLDARAPGSEERRRLVQLVDQTHRNEDE